DSSLAASGPPASPGALASPTPFATPTRSVTPTPTALQTETPPPSPSATAEPTLTATSTASTVSPSASIEPTSPPSPSASLAATPPVASPSPTPSNGAPVDIAADVVVVGQSASYSPSGEWFAFSGRPAHGTQGPDVYVWHVGDAVAHPATSDHRSVFSAWVGENVLGSRAEPLNGTTLLAAGSPPPTSSATSAAFDGSTNQPGVEARSVSFLLDPGTGASRIIPGDGIWRPVVDPSGRFAVYWSGTIEVDSNGLDWRPANGTLVLARWDPSQLVAPPQPSPPQPSPPQPSVAPGEPSATPAPASQSPSTGLSPSPGTPVALISSPPIGDWDVRWDETGTYLAVWLANPAIPTQGRLTLHTIDLSSGTIDAVGAAFTDQPAQPGFSIGDGRLAWLTPDSANGAVVKVYAWTGAKGGTAETQVQPDDTLVIR
ncbi:MAG TPA: hypothetical protein VFI28_09575, partial [Candidatus Limnocylindrales bacterium]|nr:hypothetical protein [Candidatus Limnocylindrales bacterium]